MVPVLHETPFRAHTSVAFISSGADFPAARESSASLPREVRIQVRTTWSSQKCFEEPASRRGTFCHLWQTFSPRPHDLPSVGMARKTARHFSFQDRPPALPPCGAPRQGRHAPGVTLKPLRRRTATSSRRPVSTAARTEALCPSLPRPRASRRGFCTCSLPLCHG